MQVFNIISKNNELKEITADVAVSRDDKVNTGPLSMNLAGVIDAAVQGGVEKYKEAFFDGTYLLVNPDHAPFINQFKAALGKQLEILKHVCARFTSEPPLLLLLLLMACRVVGFGCVRQQMRQHTGAAAHPP